MFDVFQGAIIDIVESAKPKQKAKRTSDGEDNESPAGPSKTADEETPQRQGKLILDATVTPQAIRYPTDLSLLNEAREFSEQIIDRLYPRTDWQKKPRTYRVRARQAYLAVAKQRRPSGQQRRRGIKQQLHYLRRNLEHIERLVEYWPEGTPIPLPRWLLNRYWVIQHVYAQQREMYQSKSRRCDDRIVSISRPYVPLIIRGKLYKLVEFFGAKLSVCLSGQGLAQATAKIQADPEGKSAVLSLLECGWQVQQNYFNISGHP